MRGLVVDDWTDMLVDAWMCGWGGWLWIAGWVCLSFDRSVSQLVGRLVGWSVGWLVGRLFVRLVDRSVGR